MAHNFGKLDLQEESLRGLRASLLAGSAFRVHHRVTGLQTPGGEAAGAVLIFCWIRTD